MTKITPSYVTQNASAGYTLALSGVAATTEKHVFAIEAGASKTVRIRRIVLVNIGSATSAAMRTFTLQRTSAAGVGGAVTPRPLDTTSGAFSGICRSLPGTNGTAGVTLAVFTVYMPNATGAFTPVVLGDWTSIYATPPQIPAGVANGIGLLAAGSVTGAADLCINVEFEE